MNSRTVKVVSVAVVVVDCCFVEELERFGYFAADGRLPVVAVVVVEEVVVVGIAGCCFAEHFDYSAVDGCLPEEVLVGCFVGEFDYSAGDVVLGTAVGFDTVAAVGLVVADCYTVAVGSNAVHQDVDCNFVDAVDSVDNSGTFPGNKNIRQLLTR